MEQVYNFISSDISLSSSALWVTSNEQDLPLSKIHLHTRHSG